MDFLKRKSIFDIIKEAEDDEQDGGGSTSSAEEESGTSTTDSGEEGTDGAAETQEDNSSEENDYGEDEDFNIDVDLGEEEEGESTDDSGGEGSSEDTTSTDTSMSSATPPEEEPVDANTNIFSSLSQEEQIIKIKELKNMYKDLYCSCDDILERLNDITLSDDNIEQINKISTTLYSLKKYISDYLTNNFANKSYIENDIFFNRFLSILNVISSTIKDIASSSNNKDKSDKK